MAAAAGGGGAGWDEVIGRCSRAIAVIRTSRVRAFDGNEAQYFHATGFVVDKLRGLLLTNRHAQPTRCARERGSCIGARASLADGGRGVGTW